MKRTEKTTQVEQPQAKKEEKELLAKLEELDEEALKHATGAGIGGLGGRCCCH
jgi:hypothetical protein